MTTHDENELELGAALLCVDALSFAMRRKARLDVNRACLEQVAIKRRKCWIGSEVLRRVPVSRLFWVFFS